ncbi:flavodoxin family protein [Nitrogeniibacter mangrovi]|uniref:Flavoprotein WrbA n=1 Tax=Nitrogeniibacter mangrovi TaxID=2016596 RepID=A0A6C1B6F3_9RHOO|nr:flavodoxin domain-containing protein [Nitrogeniibacter mangrovi]QID17824.1 flavodoxin family protein [Nitrogeniibacter mangrovi]
MSPAKTLLIVYHSQSGNTERLARCVAEGASEAEGVSVRCLRAFDAGVDDLARCDGLLLGTPENFGTMSGALKDFFDRTFYPLEGQLTGLPYAVFVSAGNDGTNAVREIGRIANGYGWREVAPACIARGEVTETHLGECRDLGRAMAEGLAMGVF